MPITQPDTRQVRLPEEKPRRTVSEAMAISIEDPAAAQLIRELSATTGEDPATAVNTAVRQRLDRLRERAATATQRRAAILRIARRAASRPVLDDRSPDEILGYDDDGLPT